MVEHLIHKIEIIVYEINETEYLLKSDANRDRLMEAKANVENKTNLIEVTNEEIIILSCKYHYD